MQKEEDMHDVNILWVDDDIEDVKEYLNLLFRKIAINFEDKLTLAIDYSNCYAQAISIIEDKKYNVYILDYELIDGNGLGVLNHLYKISTEKRFKESLKVLCSGSSKKLITYDQTLKRESHLASLNHFDHILFNVSFKESVKAIAKLITNKYGIQNKYSQFNI